MDKDTFYPSFAVFGAHSRNKGRTSITHPLRIATISAGNALGNIGVTFCPGKVQADAVAGSWARDLRTDLEAIADWGACAVVSLIEDHEIDQLQVQAIGEECGRLGLTWIHLPIPDVSIPSEAFEASWVTAGEGLRSVLRNGFSIVVHCRGGLGRAGTIAARLLTELGAEPVEAIRIVREARPGAIETEAQEQHVLRQRTIPERMPATTIDAIRDRAIGSIVGLFCGDSVGSAVEFMPRGSFEPVVDMVGGGPFNLRPGEWTDDGSMTLALGQSLLACDCLNERDLLERFVRWWRHGENSVTGRCFDIGNVTSQALARFEQTGDIHAGPTDKMTAGNGSLMRGSPCAALYWNDTAKLRDAARRQSYTTHGAQEAVDACEAFALILADAIQGKPLSDVLRPSSGDQFCDGVRTFIVGSWRGKHRDDIRSSGYALHSLEAALWCVGSSGSFGDAVLKATALGDDSDTTSACTGQLAGAMWGLSGIPKHWRRKLAWNDRIEALGNDLFEASLR